MHHGASGAYVVLMVVCAMGSSSVGGRGRGTKPMMLRKKNQQHPFENKKRTLQFPSIAHQHPSRDRLARLCSQLLLSPNGVQAAAAVAAGRKLGRRLLEEGRLVRSEGQVRRVDSTSIYRNSWGNTSWTPRSPSFFPSSSRSNGASSRVLRPGRSGVHARPHEPWGDLRGCRLGAPHAIRT